MDEAALIEGCRHGDREAQRRFYEQYVRQVYRLTLRISGSPQDAFDLTQETFVRAFQRFATFDGRAGVGTWLYRIATNEAFQLFRRRRTEQRHMRELAGLKRDATEPGGGSNRLEMEDALARLSDPERTILILKYQEGLSYEQIAEALECPPGTVASRLNRARAQLRKILEQESGWPLEESRRLPHQRE